MPEHDGTMPADEADLIVVGTGAAGFSAAITGARAGLDVVMIEKRAVIGGTTARSGTWIWVPNHRLMRDAGIDDPRDDALRYMARLNRPDRYDPDDATLGLPPDEHTMLAAFYDHASEALDELVDAGAIDPVMLDRAPDYFAELPENVAPYGRVIVSRGRERPDQLTGRELVEDLAATARRLGGRIELNCRVSDVVRDATGAVRGVVTEGQRRIEARRGVVFATGGFTHAEDLLRDFFTVPLRHGGASPGSEGDFVRIGQRLGARLHNMSGAWMAPAPIEPLVADPEAFTTNIFALRGDSMILVDRAGRRVTNEKLAYNELASVFLRWDPATAEYPNLRLFMVFDHETARLFADGKSGNPLPLPGENPPHIVSGQTLAELATALAERLATAPAEVSAGIRLAPSFASTLAETIDDFSDDADHGVDRAFARGASPIELFRNGPPRPGNDKNPAMYRFSATGPYHAIVLAPATLDTKGGPAIDPNGRVLTVDGAPIPGLYAAGNCAGFPSAHAYWAGGATVGLAITFGHLAARHAASS
jgi:succinate dehydrogenase/fumarate reductase flavoprotein subunit